MLKAWRKCLYWLSYDRGAVGFITNIVLNLATGGSRTTGSDSRGDLTVCGCLLARGNHRDVKHLPLLGEPEGTICQWRAREALAGDVQRTLLDIPLQSHGQTDAREPPAVEVCCQGRFGRFCIVYLIVRPFTYEC